MNSEKELVEVCRRWDEAMVTNDADEIGKFMTDDWVIVGTEGGITSRQEFLGWISSGTVSHNRMDADEMVVRIYGGAGIVTCRGTSAGHYNGQPFSLYEWSTSVFIRREETWRCVHTMLTPARKENSGSHSPEAA